MLELVAELVPPRSPKALLATARALQAYYDWIDIPDAPLGKPNYSSPIAATFLAAHGFRVIAHLRVADVNVIAMKTITKTAGSLGVERIVYLRGDPPTQGEPVNQVSPEAAVKYALTRPEAPEPGLLLSLRKPLQAIQERMRAGARFYLVLNYRPDNDRREKLVHVLRSGARTYIYYVLTSREADTVKEEKRIPATLLDTIESLPPGVTGIVISYPPDMETIILVGQLLREEGTV